LTKKKRIIPVVRVEETRGSEIAVEGDDELKRIAAGLGSGVAGALGRDDAAAADVNRDVVQGSREVAVLAHDEVGDLGESVPIVPLAGREISSDAGGTLAQDGRDEDRRAHVELAIDGKRSRVGRMLVKERADDGGAVLRGLVQKRVVVVE